MPTGYADGIQVRDKQTLYGSIGQTVLLLIIIGTCHCPDETDGLVITVMTWVVEMAHS
jgi:hypothetical protein